MVCRNIFSLWTRERQAQAVLFDKNGEAISAAHYPHNQIYPKPGWVEHEPAGILSSQLAAIKTVLEKSRVKKGEIAALGITNQRETTIMWNRHIGLPVCNAIVWQCRRTAELCEKYRAEGLDAYIREKTGLLIDAYFSGTKIKWILDNIPEPPPRRRG